MRARLILGISTEPPALAPMLALTTRERSADARATGSRPVRTTAGTSAKTRATVTLLVPTIVVTSRTASVTATAYVRADHLQYHDKGRVLKVRGKVVDIALTESDIDNAVRVLGVGPTTMRTSVSSAQPSTD